MDTRQSLTDLSKSLRGLHKALVERERRAYEKQWGSVDAGGLLQLLTRHPDFEWLHALSAFMAEIDDLADDERLTPDDVRAAFRTAGGLLAVKEGEPAGFAERYVAALQDAPSLAVEHMAVKRLLGAHTYA